MEDDKVFLSFEEFVGGWLGGISGLIASHPIDTMKVKLQQDKGSLMQVISATSKNEGITGFYKGIGFPAIMAGVQNAVFFGVYANVYRALKLATDSEINKILIAGCCGGFIQVLSTTPVEIIKIKLQTNKSKIGALKQPGILYTMKHIYALKGFRGFYHGFIPTAFRDVPSGGFYIGIYLSVDKYLQQYISSYWAHLLSGGLAGMASYAPVTPFDVVKTRMQADDMINPKYKNVRDCIQQSYAKNGPSIFWRGFVPTCLRAFVCNAAVFCVYEICITYLS